MTVFLNHFQQTRAVVPLFIAHEKYRDAEGFLEPVELVPDTEVRVTLNLDVAFNHLNPKLAAFVELARSLSVLVADVEQAEQGPLVYPAGEGPYTVQGLVPREPGQEP